MDFDFIKRKIRDAVENADSEISTATGTIVDLIISGAAVPITGLYGYAESIRRAVFADTCGPDDLLRHAAIKGISITRDMTTDEIRDLVLQAYRVPPSSADFWSWQNLLNGLTINMPGVGFAVFENEDARGIGSVDVVLSRQASPDNLNTVIREVNAFRPYGLADLQCSIAERFDVEIQVISQGTGVNNNMIKNEISEQYGQNAKGWPGAKIFRSRIEAIAVNYGANNAKMRWREAGTDEWKDGDAGKDKEFVNGKSVYRQSVVTECFTE